MFCFGQLLLLLPLRHSCWGNASIIFYIFFRLSCKLLVVAPEHLSQLISTNTIGRKWEEEEREGAFGCIGQKWKREWNYYNSRCWRNLHVRLSQTLRSIFVHFSSFRFLLSIYFRSSQSFYVKAKTDRKGGSEIEIRRKDHSRILWFFPI